MFNNVLLDSLSQNNDIFAFRLNGSNSVANNVAFNTVYHIDNGVLFEDSGAPATVDFKLQDNIIYINYSIGGVYFTSGTITTGRFTVSYNCYPTNPTSVGDPYNGETGRQVGDPLFLNPSYYLSGSGLSVQTGSICINHGTPVTSITRDHLCRARSASTPCIGACEGPLTATAWTGAADHNWHNYRNWDILYVPTQAISALIPNRSNYPVVSTDNAFCKSLQLQAAAVLIVQSPWIITVYY